MDTILRGSLVPIRGWDKEWFNYLESSQTESQTLKDQMLPYKIRIKLTGLDNNLSS